MLPIAGSPGSSMGRPRERPGRRRRPQAARRPRQRAPRCPDRDRAQPDPVGALPGARPRTDPAGGAGRTPAAGFGRRVVGVRRHAQVLDDVPLQDDGEGSFGPLQLDRVGGPETLTTLLSESDFIVLAAPLTPETEEMINADTLAQIKPGAWL